MEQLRLNRFVLKTNSRSHEGHSQVALNHNAEFLVNLLPHIILFGPHNTRGSKPKCFNVPHHCMRVRHCVRMQYADESIDLIESLFVTPGIVNVQLWRLSVAAFAETAFGQARSSPRSSRIVYSLSARMLRIPLTYIAAVPMAAVPIQVTAQTIILTITILTKTMTMPTSTIPY